MLDYGDQYGAAYLPHALGGAGAAIVKLENPDTRSNWIGRAGIMVRKDISKPGQSSGLPGARRFTSQRLLPWSGIPMVMAASISGRTWMAIPTGRAGSSFSGRAARFTGYSSKDGSNWSKIGEADVTGADGPLDVGVFAHRSSARFLDFRVVE